MAMLQRLAQLSRRSASLASTPFAASYAARSMSTKMTPAAAIKAMEGLQSKLDDAMQKMMQEKGDAFSKNEFYKMVDETPELKEALSKYRELDMDVEWSWARIRSMKAGPLTAPPVTVTVTGAAGAIGYALLFRIASGEMFGPSQPVNLKLLDLPAAQPALKGVMMELNDCAFPLLKSMTAADDPMKGFAGCDYAVLVGARPRSKGMERADLMKANAEIFSVQGKALNAVAPKAKVTVVGNPANTNALIASANAPDMNPDQFTAMTRLDQTRAEHQIAEKAGVTVEEVDRVVIWGNHSASQYPDISHATIQGKWAKEVITDEAWLKNEFIPTVAKRGAEIIGARGASSAASAANAAVAHVRDWFLGSDGRWVSMAVPAVGDFGMGTGIFYSVPVVCYPGGVYKRVGGVSIDPASAEMMEKTRLELVEERNAVAHLLPK